MCQNPYGQERFPLLSAEVRGIIKKMLSKVAGGSKMAVLAFGELLYDVYTDKKCVGGAPLNFAAHFVKQGGAAYVVSAVGADALGQDLLEQIREWGVDPSFVSVLPDKDTGVCRVSLDERRVPTYTLLERVAYDYIPTECVEGVSAPLLYFGTLALRSEANRQALSRLLRRMSFTDVFVDVNVRRPFISRESLLFALEHATIVKISDEELPYITETLYGTSYSPQEAVQKLRDSYPSLRLVVITCGGDGAIALDCGTGEMASCAAEKVQVVSTVGAGDSFSAAFLYRVLQGDSLTDSLKMAAKVAGFVVSQYDAVPEYDPSMW